MAEQDSIPISSPCTRESLARDLSHLGVCPGMTLIIHSSLRSLGWVEGGPRAVVRALLDVVTEDGTIVMPTQTGQYSDPAGWHNPAVPEHYWQTLYDAMPAFDPQRTSSYLMGKIVETFRTWPGTIRSNHPTVSFAAWGRHAHSIIDGHALEYGLGEGSPLARLYELAGSVLLLGVGYNRNTSFHLAEYRIPGARQIMQGSPIYENGSRVWKWYPDIEIDAAIFPAIGSAFEETGQVKIDRVGSAEARLFPLRPAVDFAVQWLHSAVSSNEAQE